MRGRGEGGNKRCIAEKSKLYTCIDKTLHTASINVRVYICMYMLYNVHYSYVHVYMYIYISLCLAFFLTCK